MKVKARCAWIIIYIGLGEISLYIQLHTILPFFPKQTTSAAPKLFIKFFLSSSLSSGGKFLTISLSLLLAAILYSMNTISRQCNMRLKITESLISVIAMHKTHNQSLPTRLYQKQFFRSSKKRFSTTQSYIPSPKSRGSLNWYYRRYTLRFLFQGGALGESDFLIHGFFIRTHSIRLDLPKIKVMARTCSPSCEKLRKSKAM